MGKGLVVGGAIVAVVVIAGAVTIPTYNNLLPKDQAVQYSYAQVQNVLNRQFNLVKGLGEVAERYAEHEQNTFVGTANGRSGNAPGALAGAAPTPPAALKANTSDIANNADLQKQLVQSEQAIQGYMIKINAAQEAYPTLKADTQFTKLSTEMEGSANRVSVERRKNQQAVMDFNSVVLHFPGVIVAKLTGFHSYPYYQADANQQEMPLVFGNK